jgi:CheY-like chemotaxis protein
VTQILLFRQREPRNRARLLLAPLLQEKLESLRTRLPAGVGLQFRSEATESTILADASQIDHVLASLCLHAAAAMLATPGVIEVVQTETTVPSGEEMSLPELSPGRYVKISIRDSGPGMSEERVRTFFEPHSTLEPRGQGTQLGLSIIRSIMKNHDGAVLVESRPAFGTTFHLYFPRIETASGSRDLPLSQRPPAPEIAGTGPRVLLVDDEPSLVRLGTQFLHRLGFRVTGSTDPVEASEAFLAEPYSFDLVITDLTMPRMTGSELADSLHRTRPDLPILLVTGFAGRLDEEQLRRFGIRAAAPSTTCSTWPRTRQPELN